MRIDCVVPRHLTGRRFEYAGANRTPEDVRSGSGADLAQARCGNSANFCRGAIRLSGERSSTLLVSVLTGDMSGESSKECRSNR